VRNPNRLVVACTEDSFAYVEASIDLRRPYTIKRCGLERRGDDSANTFVRRIKALKLPIQDVVAVLPLDRTQILQIEAPAVPPEELKAAARWRIKDMVDVHLDDLTIDVMRVGDNRPRTLQHLYVIAAANSAIQQTTALLTAAGMELAVIDICETAQRNLQNAFAEAQGGREQATAALIVHETQCLLTISANDEMFYTRRLEWDEAVFGHQSDGSREAGAAAPAYGPGVLSQQTLESVDIVDYSVEVPEFGNAHDTPRLVIELQRSFDVWERSWPDLPLSHLTVHAGAGSATLASIIKRDLGLQIEPMDTSALFKGLEGAAASAEVMEACVPLLGALLRQEVRKL
jgi:MSHA biogenesis protein MshI